MAYCLLGLFDVNMPLLYGEGGRKAFLRLQHEIIKISSDESIFAWTNQQLWSSGMFADSPADFAESGDVVVESYPRFRKPYSMTNRGLDFDLKRYIGDPSYGLTTPLACHKVLTGRPLALDLKPIAYYPASPDSAQNRPQVKDAVASMMRVNLNCHSFYRSKLFPGREPEKENTGVHFYVLDVTCRRSDVTKKINAQGIWNHSASDYHALIRRYPVFVFHITSSAPQHLFLMENMDFWNDGPIAFDAPLADESTVVLQESNSALACLDRENKVSVVLSWRCNPWEKIPTDPCLYVHTSQMHSYDEERQYWLPMDGWREPFIVTSYSSFRKSRNPASSQIIWVGLRKDTTSGVWIVDVDASEAGGLGNQTAHLGDRGKSSAPLKR